MALFGSKEVCAICGSKVSALNKVKVSDGLICSGCVKKCSPLSSSISLKSLDEIKCHIQSREINLSKYQAFSPTDSVANYIVVDRRSRTWCCPELDKANPDIFSFDDLVSYEFSEDGVTISQGGLGSAAIGGLAFGSAGAIVGASLGKKQKDVVTSMCVSITVRNNFITNFKIPLIAAETKKGGLIYNGMKDVGSKIISLLDIISSDVSSSNTSQQAPAFEGSPADELLKLKSLLDAGLLTDDEFAAAKSKILNQK